MSHFPSVRLLALVFVFTAAFGLGGCSTTTTISADGGTTTTTTKVDPCLADTVGGAIVGAALGGITLLLTFILGVEQGYESSRLTVTALCLAGITVGSTWVVLAILTALTHEPFLLVQEFRERRRCKAERLALEKEEQERRDAVLRHQEELARIAANRKPEPSPPLPTTQEILTQAKDRYDARLRMLQTAGLDDIELNAARTRAKQQYLQEIDHVMR